MPEIYQKKKPQKNIFFIKKMLGVGIVSFLLLAILVPIGIFSQFLAPILIAVLASAILLGAAYWLASVEYKKTEYVFSEKKIVYKTGTLFSDTENELPVKNVTNVHLILPFLIYDWFGTGHVSIESAGSSSTEAFFRDISAPKEVYAEVEKILENNAFSLQKSEKIVEVSPSGLAVFFETARSILVSAGVLFFFCRPAIIEISTESGVESAPILMWISGVFLFVAAIYSAIQYLDLKRRVYTVYEDAIGYTEGFLTKHFALIPFENMTDVTSTQSFLDRIFGLHDVMVSCKGAKKDIKFKNIKNGDEMASSIKDALKTFNAKEKIKQAEKKSQALKKHTENQKNNPENSLHSASEKSPEIIFERIFDDSYTDEFSMNGLRLFFFPVLLALAVIVFGVVVESPEVGLLALLILGGVYIQKIANTYSVDTNSIGSQYQFFNTSSKEFFAEQVNSIVFKESLIDKMFGTVQIAFGSLGSASKIRFKHIKKTENLSEKILAKVGIDAKSTEISIVKPEFSFQSVLLSSPIMMILLLVFLMLGYSQNVIAITIFGVLFFLGFVYFLVFYKKAFVQMHDSYVHLKKGLIIETHSYAGYEDIKDVETEKYPLLETGDVSFNVAGENVAAKEGDKKTVNFLSYINIIFWVLGSITQSVRSYSHELALSFLPQIKKNHQVFDAFLAGKSDKNTAQDIMKEWTSESVRIEKKVTPDVINILAIYAIVFILPAIFLFAGEAEISAFVVLGVVFMVLSAVTAWFIRLISFEIQLDKIVKKSGIFWKKEISILFSKIDFVNKSQGFWNKVFKNGNITINTVGSTTAEISINNIENHAEFYSALEKKV